jgi:hypothetical protein
MGSMRNIFGILVQTAWALLTRGLGMGLLDPRQSHRHPDVPSYAGINAQTITQRSWSSLLREGRGEAQWITHLQGSVVGQEVGAGASKDVSQGFPESSCHLKGVHPGHFAHVHKGSPQLE